MKYGPGKLYHHIVGTHYNGLIYLLGVQLGNEDKADQLFPKQVENPENIKFVQVACGTNPDEYIP